MDTGWRYYQPGKSGFITYKVTYCCLTANLSVIACVKLIVLSRKTLGKIG